MLLTSGYLADFKTGYLQIAIPEHQCEVMDGADINGGKIGFAAGRLVKLVRLADGSCYITAPANVTATSVGTATHIVAQTDDSLDTTSIKGEQFNTAASGILANTTADAAATDAPTGATGSMKRVALYKIVNADDIKIIPVKHATISVVR